MSEASTNSTHNRIAALECWNSDIDIEPLGGGMTNLNFKITDGSEQFVVRLGNDDPIHLISRANEAETCRAAFNAGVSPELVHTEPGMLVVRFVDGQVYEEADVRKDDKLPNIIKTITRFHDQVPMHYETVPVMFWVFQVLRHYQSLLAGNDNPYRKQLDKFTDIAAALQKAVGKVDIVFGHNDLLAANFIDDGEKVWLIDFDYAGFNSPLFDLANLASNNDLSQDQEGAMLESYFGASVDRNQWRSYYAMKSASLLRETLWSMVSEKHSTLDVDFAAYTAKNLERFEAMYDTFCTEYQ